MKKDEPSDYVRLAATNALLNSLEFTKANFDNEVGTSCCGGRPANSHAVSTRYG